MIGFCCPPTSERHTILSADFKRGVLDSSEAGAIFTTIHGGITDTCQDLGRLINQASIAKFNKSKAKTLA